MGLSLPPVEFYALGLAATWLSLAASVALAVSGAPVVELVDAVEEVEAAVQVATVSPPCQSGPWSVPNGVGSSSGLKGDVSPSKGSVSPGLGVVIGTGALPGAGSCSSINGASPG